MTDEAVINGVPWPAQLAGGTAATLFQRNPNWGTCSVSGTVAYWVRFDPEETVYTVRMEEFVIGVCSAKAADIAAIMAYAPSQWAGWAADADSSTIFDSTTDGSWAVFAGETVLKQDEARLWESVLYQPE